MRSQAEEFERSFFCVHVGTALESHQGPPIFPDGRRVIRPTFNKEIKLMETFAHTAIEQQVANVVNQHIKTIIEDKVTLLVKMHLDRVMRNRLEVLIDEAKDAAVKQIAAKLLRLALEESK